MKNNKVAIIYESFSGNTSAVKDIIEQELVNNKINYDVFKVKEFNVNDIESYSGLIIGTLTWGDGALPSSFKSLTKSLIESDLTNTTIGVFGTGDDIYKHFCGGVDVLVNLVKDKSNLMGRLKILLYPNDNDKNRCILFTRSFINKANLIKESVEE